MPEPRVECPITSAYAADEEMADLVDLFVNELPDRVAAFVSALESDNWHEVQVISHQLKGAAPGYGFDLVGEAAGQVEKLLLENASVDQRFDAAREFIALCGRVSKV